MGWAAWQQGRYSAHLKDLPSGDFREALLKVLSSARLSAARWASSSVLTNPFKNKVKRLGIVFKARGTRLALNEIGANLSKRIGYWVACMVKGELCKGIKE